jgi:hypothetical protein
MPIDYSKIPTGDLEALSKKDYSKVSTATLEMLKGGSEISTTTPPEEGPKERAEKYGEIKERTWKDTAADAYYGVAKPTIEGTALGVGAVAGGAGGNIPGAIAGAGVMYGGAKSVLEKGEEAVGLRQPQGRVGSVLSGMQNVAEGMTYQMTGELFGAGLTAAGNRVLSQNMSPEGVETLNLLRKRGVKPLPSELSPTKTRALFEKVLSYSPVSGDVFYKDAMGRLENSLATAKRLTGKAPDQTIEQVGGRIKKEATALLEKYTNKKTDEINAIVTDLLDTYGVSTRSEAGTDISKILVAAKEVKKQDAQRLYDQTSELLPKKGSDVIPLSDKSYSVMSSLLKEEMSNPVPSKRNAGVVSTLKAILGTTETKEELPENVARFMMAKDPLLRKLIEAEKRETRPEVTWTGLKKLKTALFEASDRIKRTQLKDTEASRAYDMVSHIIDTDMEAFAKQKGGNLWETYDKARQSWREMEQSFTPEVRKLMNKKPEEIVGTIVRGKDKGLSLFRQIKQAGGEEAVEPIRKALFKLQLRDATVNGTINPNKLEKIIQGVGDDMKNEVYTSDQLKMFQTIIDKGKQLVYVKGNYKTFEFLETIAGDSNSKIVDSIVKPENIQNILMAKRLLSSDRMKEIEQEVLEKHIFSKGGSGYIKPVTTASNFNKYSSVLKELMSKDTFKGLSEFVRSEARSDRLEKLALNASGTAQILIGEGIFSRYMKGILDILTLHPIKGTGEVLKETAQLALNKVVAKIYTSDLATQYFSDAMRLPPNSPAAISSFIRAIQVVEFESGKPQKTAEQSPTTPIKPMAPQKPQPSPQAQQQPLSWFDRGGK